MKRLKNFLENVFLWRSLEKNFCEDLFFFFLESTCACVLGPWPWPRAFLSLASRVSVLGKAVLGFGLGFFFVSLALTSSLASSTPPLINRSMRLQLIICHKKELLSSLFLIKLVLVHSKCYQCLLVYTRTINECARN